MTRSKFIDLLAQRFPQYSHQDIEVSVTEIINGLSDAMTAGRRIEIRSFGSFVLKYRKERTGRNPRTGKRVLSFRASKKIRLQVNDDCADLNEPTCRTPSSARRHLKTTDTSDPQCGLGMSNHPHHAPSEISH